MAMRRRVLLAAAGGLLLMTLLCGVGTLRAWTAQGQHLVLPGASEVQIDRRGPFRLSIVYRLPGRKTLHDLSQHFVRQGWRRLRSPNTDRSTVSFARSQWSGQMREILIVSVDPDDRRVAQLQFARCFRVNTWARCM
jgi:hypothetical protein